MKTVQCYCGVVEDVSDDSRRTQCYKHHLGGVSFSFVSGGGYGRSNFNSATIEETRTEILEGAARNGIEVEPVSKGCWS